MKQHCLSSQEIENRLKQAGINATAQRIAICRYVLCEADHPTAEQVKAWVDQHFPKMSLATVYNTLHILVEAGLLRELKFSHLESALYDCHVSDHAHFLDEKTGKLYDIPPEAVQLDFLLDKKFKVTGFDLLLRGTLK